MASGYYGGFQRSYRNDMTCHKICHGLSYFLNVGRSVVNYLGIVLNKYKK